MAALVIQIRVGQKWRDRDKRMLDRIMIVRSLDSAYAYLGHPRMARVKTRVRIENLRSRWELVS